MSTDSTGPFRPEDHARGILAVVLESSDDAIITKDLDGVVRSWNRAAERLLGYAADEIVGRSLLTIIPAERRSELMAILERVKAGERVEHHETIRRAKDGRLVDISLTVSPVRDANGHIVGAAAITRDLTSRKLADAALENSEARWRAIVESAVDAVIVIDAGGRIEAFNPAAERLFGYAEREAIGRSVNMLMPSPQREEHDGYIARYLTTGVKKIIGVGREVIALRRDGSTFPVRLSVGEVRIGAERKFTGILHDLSARVRIEEQLREQTTLARLGEMAAVIAHEVKNPLAGVRGAIQVIGSRLPRDSKDAGMVKEIVARIDALNELMQDLLLFARPPHPRPALVEVASVVRMTAELLKSNPDLRNVSVAVEGTAPPIPADPDLLKIVFENLLVNGAQAMGATGTLRVSIDVSGDMCRITFRDTGPGIPSEVRDRIFTPFFTTKARGTGLGLPTAKRLVEAHRGAIAIACPPEGGTIVTIQLPAR
jgi:two-component system sensor kinase FixL